MKVTPSLNSSMWRKPMRRWWGSMCFCSQHLRKSLWSKRTWFSRSCLRNRVAKYLSLVASNRDRIIHESWVLGGGRFMFSEWADHKTTRKQGRLTELIAKGLFSIFNVGRFSILPIPSQFQSSFSSVSGHLSAISDRLSAIPSSGIRHQSAIPAIHYSSFD